jgi:hypothetical protein
MTTGPEYYGRLGRVGNAIYVIMIALAIIAFLLSILGNLPKATTAQDTVIYVVGSALMSLVIWGIGWAIRWALGGGPAK